MAMIVTGLSVLAGPTATTFKARFDAIVKSQQDASDRYSRELAGNPTPQAPQAAIDRYVAEVRKNTQDVLGRDHEGKPFALSDFRGKVVLLIFSANWCGPCVAMYPQERELVARLNGKPFALVGVNTDATVETLKKSVQSGEITWRCWYDGAMAGPITTRWGVSAVPMTFVLDKAGLIRFMNLRGKELDQAVETLVNEPPLEKPAPR